MIYKTSKMTKDTGIIEITFKEITTPNGLFCQFDEEHGVLLLDVKNPFSEEDFKIISDLINPYYSAKGELRGVIINSKKFPRWKNSVNRLEYIEFASSNHHKFKKAALGMGGFFIKILLRLAKSRIHPQVKMFKYQQIDQAQDWILYN